MWLLLEPIGLFGVNSQFFARLGWYGYLFIILTTTALTIPALDLFRRHRFTKLKFIELRVESSTDGGLHFVRAPENLQVWDFIALFLNHLKKGPAGDTIDAMCRIYIPVLYVRTDDADREILDDLTLREADLKNGDVCFIKGRPRKDEVRFCLSRRDDPTHE